MSDTGAESRPNYVHIYHVPTFLIKNLEAVFKYDWRLYDII